MIYHINAYTTLISAALSVCFSIKAVIPVFKNVPTILTVVTVAMLIVQMVDCYLYNFQKGLRIMILGERIKRIRTFRGLTQRELGLKLGYEERNADVRVAQYESGYRVPKNNTLMEMAKILNVNYIHFVGTTPGCAEDIILTLLWLDEDDRSTIHLFQLVRNPGKCNASDDKLVRYYDNDDWPAHAPVGMWFDYGLVNEFLREWCLRKEQLKSREISEDEYFEWKINWPASSNSVNEKGNDTKNNSYQWRK